ncbi:hypothetical protein DM02DRAFT_686847 [Periconia macrospinosa]|uniref:C2H2-type domain-containing protein n=1 Tax=Periconia macrospinosa TaxID=97972 RepID=A0A2V1DFM8_9PLEO|nr:hypothetical protein DM02DRAFT_686847 [Periconia macrospinosa]
MSVSVAEQCRECLTNFTAVASSLAEPDRKPSRVHPRQVKDELDRFSLWIGNIGALHPPMSSMSLESRLREAEEVLSHIQDLLEDLQEVVVQLLSIASGEREGEVASSAHDNEYGEDSEDREVSEETELFEQISASITRLFRVTSLIRRAAPTDLFAKALSRNRYRFNDEFDIAHVGEKYPKLRSDDLVWLQKRLGRAITQRRHYLSYIRNHREKLEEPLGPEHHEIPGSKPQARAIEQLQGVKHTPDSSSRPSTYFTKATTISPSQITSQMLTVEEESDPENDARSYTTISRSVDGDLDSLTSSRIPNLAELRSGKGKEVECPFCFRMQKFKNDRIWRRHVYNDLRSYVCTFQDCDSSFFGDINEWFRHEMQNHRVSYACMLCKGKTFNLKEGYLAHVRRHHPDMLEHGGEQPILDISRRPLERISAAECPCCSEWVGRLRERAALDSDPDGVSDDIFTIPNVFKRHLASHLEQLALFSIPIRPSTDGSASSNVAIEEDKGSVAGVSDLSALEFNSSRPSSLSGVSLSSIQSAISYEKPFDMLQENDEESELNELGQAQQETVPRPQHPHSKYEEAMGNASSDQDGLIPCPKFLRLSKTGR